MTGETDLMTGLYAHFNARDIEAVLAMLHPEVMWANGMEGGHVRGRAGVREYWTRQWATIDPHVEPQAVSIDLEGAVNVDVRQVVRDLGGGVLSDRRLVHVFRIEDGLIRRFDIR